MVNEQTSALFCSKFLVALDKVYNFCESVNEYGDGGHLPDFGKSMTRFVVICWHFRCAKGIG